MSRAKAGHRGNASAWPALVLDPARVHAWRIERHLLGRSKAASPVDVARTLVGVQAQVSSSAALAIALRLQRGRGKAPATDAVAAALRDRRLVRSWAMRGTLHLFVAADVPIVVAAMRGKDNWRRPAWLRWFGVTEPEMEQLVHGIGEILDDGRPRTRVELGEDLGARYGPKLGKLVLGSWGSALKIASDYGYVCQSAGEPDGAVRFVRPSRWIAEWREADHDESLRELLARYLAAYGPASLRETARWWGVAIMQEIKAALEALRDRVTQVEVDGDVGYVRTEDLDAIMAMRPRRGSVQLVGGFDPLIVGAGLRDQLLPPAHLKRVSRTAGWISPVVLVDGRAAGIWDSRRTSKGLSITIEPFEKADRTLRDAIDVAARQVGVVQGLEVWVGFGRVFTEKRSSLTIQPGDA